MPWRGRFHPRFYLRVTPDRAAVPSVQVTAPVKGGTEQMAAQPARYEIRVEGTLGEEWPAWFGGLHVASEGSYTVICGVIPDQPALHGLLDQIRDLGLCLIWVRRTA